MVPLQKVCDYLVLGGGSGGLASGRRASALYGATTIVVESARLGGTCVNVGCMPKKITWNAATLAEQLHDAKAYGFSWTETAPFNWNAFKHKRDAFIKQLNRVQERNLENDKVEYVAGRASFVDKDEVEVQLQDGAISRIKAKHILIASGGNPTLTKSIPGAELGITSDGFFELEKQPKAVALIGAGYIAAELAGMLRALGTETHLFIRREKFLRSFDPMIQDTMFSEYERRGIFIHKKSTPSKIENLGNRKRLYYTDANGSSTVDVDAVIWAVGRTPDTKDLHLDNIGVKLNSKGHIPVDDFQNTSAPQVYAVGDVCDRGFELTPVAIAAGRRLADRLFGGQHQAKLDYANIPSVVFAHPEIGSIGMTEPKAREKYGDAVKVYETSFTATFYVIMDEVERSPSKYKVICVGPEEKVVGLHIVGLGSIELLQGFGVAIKMGATKKDFESCVPVHPTSVEELITLK